MSDVALNHECDYDLEVADTEVEDFPQVEGNKRYAEPRRFAVKRFRVAQYGSTWDADAAEAKRRVEEAVTRLPPVELVYHPRRGKDRPEEPVRGPALPEQHGKRALPRGHPFCFAGKSFIITGALPTLTLEDVETLILNHGGRISQQVTPFVHFIVAGRHASRGKCDRARSKRIPIIDQDGLFELIKAGDVSDLEPDLTRQRPLKVNSEPPVHGPSDRLRRETIGPKLGKRLWVDKHRPKTARDIIANTPAVAHLTNWLENWRARHAAQKLVHSIRGKSSTGEVNYNKAVMLSGQPGSGKTMLAHIICQDLDLEIIEMTAIEDRSPGANDRREGVAGRVSNRMHALCQNTLLSRAATLLQKRAVLVIDEIENLPCTRPTTAQTETDVAVLGERGALEAVIEIIKASEIPVICIGNDVRNPRLAPLKPYCTQLEMRPLGRTSLLAPLILICRAEGLHVCHRAMKVLAKQSLGDVRGIINSLQGTPFGARPIGVRQTRRGEVAVCKSRDHYADGTTRILFGAEGNSRMWEELETMVAKELDFVPYFVQENYIHQHPVKAVNEAERLIVAAKAAKLLSYSERLHTVIEEDEKYELAPSAVSLDIVAPATLMRGHREALVQEYNTLRFGMLHYEQILKAQETQKRVDSVATRMRWEWKTSISDEAVLLDYIPAIGSLMLYPLMYSETSGPPFVVDLINNYHWNREHYDMLLDMTEPSFPDPSVKHSVITQYMRSRGRVRQRIGSRELACPVDVPPRRLTNLEDLLMSESILSHDSCVIREDDEGDPIEEFDAEKLLGQMRQDGYKVTLHSTDGVKPSVSGQFKQNQASLKRPNGGMTGKSIYKLPPRFTPLGSAR